MHVASIDSGYHSNAIAFGERKFSIVKIVLFDWKEPLISKCLSWGNIKEFPLYKIFVNNSCKT